ncbi:Ankyrin repeat-containing domain [Phytophthora cactorum]|nr:Ankyrin repeat-containing domain [Phytophthora cactorum]
MAFRCVGSPLDEMKRLEKLLERDPESAANLVANGKLLVDFVRDGNLRALQCAAEHLEEVKSCWYSIYLAQWRVLNTCLSLLSGSSVDLLCRSDVSRGLCDEKTGYLRFMLLNSFDLQQSYMRDILHNIIENVDSPQSADAVQPLIRFLLDAGVDINWQRKSDLYTALHVACCQNLYPSRIYLFFMAPTTQRAIRNSSSELQTTVALTMSCSLIEAKFQVLDRTIKMLSKSKKLRTPRVASSDQLRELVETQKPTSLLPTIKPVKDVVVTRSNQTQSSINRGSRSSQTRLVKTSQKRNMGHHDLAPEGEIPTKARLNLSRKMDRSKAKTSRAATAGHMECKAGCRDTGSRSREVPRSKLLNDNYRDEGLEQDSNPCEERIQDQHASNQIHDDAGTLELRRKKCCRTTQFTILLHMQADDENCLLFDDPRLAQGSTPSRYFNPFLYFPGLSRPSDVSAIERSWLVTCTYTLRVSSCMVMLYTRNNEGQVVELTEAEQAQHQLQMEQQLKSFWAKQLLEMEQLEVGSEQGAASATKICINAAATQTDLVIVGRCVCYRCRLQEPQ